jgi:uncharacterized cupredoxin-like copper-binding protein
MRSFLRIALGAVCVWLIGVNWANSADLSQQDPIEIVVELGTQDGGLVFTPNALTFQAGKLYKLVLVNQSKSQHYFSALRFAAAVWTRKVEVEGAEIKGAIREIEVLPGGQAAWFIVPVQAGTFELQCTVPGHAEAGMIGEIMIE